jgi:hypothetical protein
LNKAAAKTATLVDIEVDTDRRAKQLDDPEVKRIV